MPDPGELARRLKAIREARQVRPGAAPASGGAGGNSAPPAAVPMNGPARPGGGQDRAGGGPAGPGGTGRGDCGGLDDPPARGSDVETGLAGYSWAGPAGDGPAGPAGTAGRPEEAWEAVAEGVYCRRCRLDLADPGWPPGLRNLFRDCLDRGLPDQAEDCWYLDTETTGLSGGAGTHIFLLGWARLHRPDGGSGPVLETTQYFLADFPAEPEFVAWIEAVFQRDFPAGRGLLVTYNGASFDLPLIRSRWIMNGRFWPDYPHLDRLPEARRLWKGLHQSCSLGYLEEQLFGVRRVGDPGGAMVPVLYFQWLRQAAAVPFWQALEGVLDHHRQDLVSLLALDLACRLIMAGCLDCLAPPESDAGTGQPEAGRTVDGGPPWALGRSGRGQPEFSAGHWQVELDGPGLYRNLLHRARGCRRQGLAGEAGRLEAAARELGRREWQGSGGLWWGRQVADGLAGDERLELERELWDRFQDPVALRACLVQLEHRRRDPQAALDLLEAGARLLGQDWLASADQSRRLARLRQKLGRLPE